jgi:hypothetical protein
MSGDDSSSPSKELSALHRSNSSHSRFHVDKVDSNDEMTTPDEQRKTSTATSNGRFQVTIESSTGNSADVIGSAIAATAAASAAAASRSVRFSVGGDNEAAVARLQQQQQQHQQQQQQQQQQQRNDSISTNNDSTIQMNFRSWRLVAAYLI